MRAFPSFPVERSVRVGLNIHLRNNLMTVENRTCLVLDAKMDDTELWRTSPNPIQLKPGKSLPPLVDSKEHTHFVFRLNKARIY